MRRSGGKLDHLSLDRWAIPGAGPFNSARIKCGFAQILTNVLTGSVRRVSDPAWQLFHGEQLRIQSENVIVCAFRQRKKAETDRRLVDHLFFESVKIDCQFIDSTWSA